MSLDAATLSRKARECLYEQLYALVRVLASCCGSYGAPQDAPIKEVVWRHPCLGSALATASDSSALFLHSVMSFGHPHPSKEPCPTARRSTECRQAPGGRFFACAWALDDWD